MTCYKEMTCAVLFYQMLVAICISGNVDKIVACETRASMIELRHVDVCHFQSRHLANGCAASILFLCLSCLAAMICYINTTAFVSVYA